MASSMIPISATAQRVVTLECAPCALRRAMQRRGQHSWTPLLADFAVDLVAGALTLADATEVLVPSSLVHYIEEQRVRQQTQAGLDNRSSCTSGSTWPWPTWDTALQEHRLVTWTTAQDAPRLLCSVYGPLYANLCVPVPSGPLVSQMDFGLPIDVFYQSTLPTLLDAVSDCQRSCNNTNSSSASHHHHNSYNGTRWRAWMRGALTCAYEGTHVPPIRMSDYTSQLLRQDGGCESVIWEAAVRGLTPRWLETATKTALAVGVNPLSVALALPEESSWTSRLLTKSVEVGIASWMTCALTNTSLYPHADPLCTPQSLRVLTTGWNELSTTLSPVAAGRATEVSEAEESLAQCADFVDAAQQRYNTLLSC